MTKVLFVCMGNICRSPTAHGVFLKIIKDQLLNNIMIEVDSAGTHAYHVGEQPDPRSQSAALRRGVDLSSLRARKVNERDFECFDYVLAMDYENYSNLERICPAGFEHRLRLFLDFASEFEEKEVPDPYYGGDKGFEHVLDLVEDASRGLLKEILQTLNK